MADVKEGGIGGGGGRGGEAENGKVKTEAEDRGHGISHPPPRPANGTPTASAAAPLASDDASYPGSSVLNERFNRLFDGDVEMMDVDDKPGPAPSSKSKKKGTATAVKKRRPGGPGAKAGGPRKAASKKGGRANSADTQRGSDADEDEESDHGPYCICRGPDDHRWMIQCEECEDWFHGECVHINKTIGEALIQRYVCPHCTDGQRIVTRYKKTCSLDGCNLVARIYAAGAGGAGSIFCSDRHRDEWWDRLVATLPPKARLKPSGDALTREDFAGLLSASARERRGEDGWRLGDPPFGVPPDFWARPGAQDALTEEESAFLSASAAERYQLAEEIVLTKKMQQLLDMANEQRKAAVAAKRLEPDGCGYDYLCDVIGAQAQFAAFLKTPGGEAVFKAGRLDAAAEKEPAAGGSHWCERRRCKPHAQWYNLFTKGNRQQIKELAAQAKEKLDAETRVRDAAAVRFFRKKKERNWVTVIESDDSD